MLFLLYEGPRIVESWRQKGEDGGCQGLEEGGIRSFCLMGTVSVLDDENVVEMDSSDCYTSL